jgi:hypothetical protein
MSHVYKSPCKRRLNKGDDVLWFCILVKERIKKSRGHGSVGCTCTICWIWGTMPQIILNMIILNYLLILIWSMIICTCIFSWPNDQLHLNFTHCLINCTHTGSTAWRLKHVRSTAWSFVLKN